MTPFKERMNLYRAYRELNPDKNYWDWKASLEVPAMKGGGNTGQKPKSISEAIAEAEEVEKRLNEKDTKSHPFVHELDFSDNNTATPFADAAHVVNRNAQSLSDSTRRLVSLLQKEKEEQLLQDVSNYKLMANSLATAAELGSGIWMLGKGANAVNLLPQRFGRLYNSDVAQVTANTIGTAADAYQLFTANTPQEVLENSIELPADVAGVIGGTNIVRNTPWFGRYGNTVDNVLDAFGYGAATYDVLLKPAHQVYKYLTDDKEVPAMRDGGNTEDSRFTPIAEPVVPESNDLYYTNWQANWLNSRREQLYNNLDDLLYSTSGWISLKEQKNDIRDNEWDYDHNLGDYSILPLFKGESPERVWINKEYYKLLNNAAVAPDTTLNTSFGNVNGAYVPLSNWDATGHYIVYPEDVNLSTKIHERTHASSPRPQEKKIESITGHKMSKKGADIDREGYIRDPREVYARLMQFRHDLQIDPNKVFKENDLDQYRKELEKYNLHIFSDDLLLRIFNEVASSDQKRESLVYAARNGGLVSAMFPGGEVTDEERELMNRNRYFGVPYEQGLELDPVADAFNPMNDVYDIVQVGKDAAEGNWAGVGAGLALAAMPKWMEKVGGAVKSGVKHLINKARKSDDVDWNEIVSGLAVPVKKDPTSGDAMPVSNEVKVDHRRVAGLSGETPPRYLDYGDVEFQDYIGYTRPQWLKDVQEFYDTDVATRERRFATDEGVLYGSPVYQNRSDHTFNSEHPVHVRQYLDDTKFAGYANGDEIVMVRNSRLAPDLILVHEGTHIDQNNVTNLFVPTTEIRFADIGGVQIPYNYYVPTLEKTLNKAYDFTEDFLERHPNLHELFEMGASNREMRYALWKEHGKPSMEELDKIIDNMSDDDIRYLLTQANGYTRDFNRRIIEKEKAGEDIHYDIQMIKLALKYVPAFAAPMMINNTEDKSN